MNFLKVMKMDIEEFPIFIHCHAGISRSGAVGQFATDMFRLDQKVFEKTEFGWFQVLRLPLTKARWVRFDCGESATGVSVRAVRIYKGYEHPKLVEVTKLLHEKIKPGLPGL